MRVRWTERASIELMELAERAPGQAIAVLDAMNWMAELGFSLGRSVGYGRARKERYWAVPPQGVYYYRDGDLLIVTALRDARRRLGPW